MTMKISIAIVLVFLLMAKAFGQDGTEILEKIDKNMSSTNRIFESSMTIHGKRNSRTITSRSWSEGVKKSFSEYLSPASEKGTKMLKLANQLWIYSPSSDRIIQISGHLLRQSVMGSDLSYEDMMDDRNLTEIYSAEITGKEVVEGCKTLILLLKAKVENVAYQSQKMWIDEERMIPLRQELYSKSGQLLKRMELSDVEKIQGRWFPKTILFKDLLKEGNGTEFKMTNIKFDQQIPETIFTKAALKQ